jgi:phosphatidylethanolamine/phosphatidyl-N-methylethanolamine N-methyltransferase
MLQVMPDKLPDAPAKKIRHQRGRHHFIVAAMRAPFQIGGFLPSSRTLARAMAAAVDVSREGSVVELGAGTGVVTHALLKAGIAVDKLVVFERDERLHAVLSQQYHHLNILQADAIGLAEVLASIGVKKVNAVVSSLPFLVMPLPVRQAIQQQMAQVIGEDGVIVQFTYGTKSPISIQEMRKNHLHGKRVKLVMANVPPAHIWVYSRIAA